MFRKFINRKKELKFLEAKFKENNFNFVVLYGRRRVGKTELVKQFIKKKPAIYFLSDKRGTEINLERFKEKVSEHLREPKVDIKSFDKLFAYLSQKLAGKKLIVAIDEFSYLVERDKSVPSVFQLLIDEVLINSNIFLILLGSSISMMEEGVLSAKSPLYGRRTGQFKLEALSLKDSLKFFPNYDLENTIEIYSVLGGVPFYLVKGNDEISVLENVKQIILKKGEVLYEEIDFLLREELRNPSTYKSILEAIASGSTKTTQIANKAKIETKDLDRYLKVLIRLGYIKKLTPVTEKPKSKKSIYLIRDNYFKFWFTFCYPKISDLEIGEIENILASIKLKFDAFVGKSFEDVCRQFIKEQLKFKKIGKWWGYYRDHDDRKEVEIDICALNEDNKEILFGECKWKENVNVEKLLLELKAKTEHVQWYNSERKEYYAIFAKSFSKKVKEKNVCLYDLKDLEKKIR